VAGLGNDGSGTLLTNARDALAQVQNLVAIQNKQQAGGTTAGAAGAAAVTAAGAAPAQSTTHNVNITLNGQTTSIGAASAADAASLTSLLTQLANAANRTTG